MSDISIDNFKTNLEQSLLCILNILRDCKDDFENNKMNSMTND